MRVKDLSSFIRGLKRASVSEPYTSRLPPPVMPTITIRTHKTFQPFDIDSNSRYGVEMDEMKTLLKNLGTERVLLEKESLAKQEVLNTFRNMSIEVYGNDKIVLGFNRLLQAGEFEKAEKVYQDMKERRELLQKEKRNK